MNIKINYKLGEYSIDPFKMRLYTDNALINSKLLLYKHMNLNERTVYLGSDTYDEYTSFDDWWKEHNIELYENILITIIDKFNIASKGDTNFIDFNGLNGEEMHIYNQICTGLSYLRCGIVAYDSSKYPNIKDKPVDDYSNLYICKEHDVQLTLCKSDTEYKVNTSTVFEQNYNGNVLIFCPFGLKSNNDSFLNVFSDFMYSTICYRDAKSELLGFDATGDNDCNYTHNKNDKFFFYNLNNTECFHVFEGSIADERVNEYAKLYKDNLKYSRHNFMNYNFKMSYDDFYDEEHKKWNNLVKNNKCKHNLSFDRSTICIGYEVDVIDEIDSFYDTIDNNSYIKLIDFEGTITLLRHSYGLHPDNCFYSLKINGNEVLTLFKNSID